MLACVLSCQLNLLLVPALGITAFSTPAIEYIIHFQLSTCCIYLSWCARLRRLMEIESRLLPCGLHVVGRPPTAIEAIATLVNIAEVDRPENDPPIRGLPGILARSIGRNVEEIYSASNRVSCWLLVDPCTDYRLCAALCADAHIWQHALVTLARNWWHVTDIVRSVLKGVQSSACSLRGIACRPASRP